MSVSRPVGGPEIGPVCDVFWAPAGPLAPTDLGLLSGRETDRLALLRDDGDRRRFVAATVLLRRVVAEATGVRPRDVELDRRCGTCGADHGRPRLPGTGLFASIAHAGDLVGVASTRCAAVGLDVEADDGRDLMPIRDEVLGPGETARSSSELRRYWTRKEAVVKATGDGVGVGLGGVLVTPPDRPAALLAYPGGQPLRVQLADLGCRPGHVAAAAVLTAAPVRFVEHTG